MTTNFLDIILDNIEESLIIIDSASKVLLFNKKAVDTRQLIEWDKLEVGADFLEGMSDLNRRRARGAIDDLLIQKSPIKKFDEIDMPDGTKGYFEVSYFPVLSDDAVSHIIVIHRDVSVDKIFEKKITTLANDLTNLIERATAVIIGVDSRGYITDWNRHCNEVIGYTKNEVYAKKFGEILLKEEERPLFERLLVSTLKGKSTRNFEIVIRAKAGHALALLLSATPRTTATNSVTGFILVGQDITELTAYRESLEKLVEQRTRELKKALDKEKELLEMKSRFVSMVSHEFRTPLATINFAASYIKKYKGRLDGEDIDRKLEQIEHQIKHMTFMLEDVITIGKSDTTKIKTNLNLISIKEFLQGITDEITEVTNGTHRINLGMDVSIKKFKTDEKLLRNIFLNLLSNAIKYSPGKQHVDFTVVENEKFLVFEISDYGLGMHEQELPKIFEPFHRSESVTHISGAGLGLSIVKRAVDLLEGDVTVHSRYGEGTRFTTRLPKHNE
jgi:PAS domain S-box-containing protein